MPNLSAKELTALGEQLDLEQMLVAKFQAMSNQTTDPQIKQKLSDIANKHQCHYDQLKVFLS
ncbi:MAG: spore coat protein [Clostridia bacterium]